MQRKTVMQPRVKRNCVKKELILTKMILLVATKKSAVASTMAIASLNEDQ